MAHVLALAVGSLAGGFARYYLTGFVNRGGETVFPWGTFAVNAAGCFLIGFFASLSEAKLWFGPSSRLLLMTGFCGAFTTFSTFLLETHGLIRGGEPLKAFFNVTGSLAAGFLVFYLGMCLAERF